MCFITLMWTTYKLDLVNRNGAKLCEYFGCRKHTTLSNKFGGLFCKKHVKELAILRSCKGKESSKQHQIEWRVQEQLSRKIQCPKHWYYVITIMHGMKQE